MLLLGLNVPTWRRMREYQRILSIILVMITYLSLL